MNYVIRYIYAEFYSSMLVGDRAMSQQRVVPGRCSASSSASAAVPCIHRPFEDPPNRRSGPATAFPDSTGVLLHRPCGRGKASSTDVVGGLMDSLHGPTDWSNTPAGNSASTSAAVAAGFCTDGVDSSSSDSELQYSKDTCIQNSSTDDCSKKRMIDILTSVSSFQTITIV